MACILFVYTRISIRAAKENAQRHRDADGGQLSLLNEHRRRHGQAERLERGGNTVTELASEAREQLLGASKKVDNVDAAKVGSGRSEGEERLRGLKGRMSRKPGSEQG
ncbi:hypothetical protein LTR08_003319 [Meristemomyces frigidus]|nr:hypothetical protein LTR08_003319 [Meristemomyces frigidus]